MIEFSINKNTDVTIAINNKEGKTIRHLVSGTLGKNPPLPFKANSLSQTIYLGDDKQAIGKDITSISVSTKGELFVMGSENSWG